MPTVLRAGPYRVYFVSHDFGEPPHVHVDRDRVSAKFWLAPVSLARNLGFPSRELRAVQRLIVDNQPKASALIRGVRFSDDSMSVDLADGRTITVPLAWYPRLLHATPSQRANWKIAGAGYGIHWPDVDEDLSSEGLLRGAPAPRATADTR